ncbi:MAG: hypothetical protein EXS50_00645 [Candidatus Taylorbacteria bacterium]|nr:hypothetical protein [Candidatus Taylorbacteria bacterium]
MNTRSLKGIPPTKGMLQAAIFARPDAEERKLVFPHSLGYSFECGFDIKVLHGAFAGKTFVFVGIVLKEDGAESDELIVGSFDLSKLVGQATTGHKVTEREDLQTLTGFTLPKFN